MDIPINPNSLGLNILANMIEMIKPEPRLIIRPPKSQANAIPDFLFKEFTYPLSSV